METKRKLTIEKLQKIAQERGGKCLSTKYYNAVTKLEWECKHGHTWWTRPAHVANGSWCPICSGRNKYNIQYMRNYAVERNGKCLSLKYKNTETNLLWQCEEGHKWWAIPSNVILKSSWCPECTWYRSETYCRNVLEIMLGRKFPKRRPGWLKTEEGNKLELDGYSSELKLAFEYHGRQHYEEVPYLHRGQSFELRKKLDDLKRKLCKKNGVMLLEIPYIIRPSEYQVFILKQLKKFGLDDKVVVRKKIKHVSLDSYNKTMIKELKNIASKRDGKCIGKRYTNAKTPIKWRCKQGHVWLARPNDVKRGKWCRKCATKKTADKLKLSIEDMQVLARKRRGKCLSEVYVNSISKLQWQCDKGHKWWATPGNVGQGKWCLVCSGSKKYTLYDMQQVAIKCGGKCLSKKYLNIHSKLNWKCGSGHGWIAVANNVNRGSWCPKCFRLRKYKSQK